VYIGVHQDGLVHVSALTDKFVRNPHDVVKANQRVEVTVMDVDIKRNRIALSMRSDPMNPRGRRNKDTTPGKKETRQQTCET